MNKRILWSVALSTLSALVFSACGSSDTAGSAAPTAVQTTSATTTPTEITPTETTPAETTPAETTAIATAAAETTAAESTAAAAGSTVERLADDSPTCNSIRKVKELNDKAGALTEQFTSEILKAKNAVDPAAVQKSFDEYIKTFREQSNEVIPQLTDAYKVLATEQPQFATQLDNLSEVTVVLVKKLGDLEGVDLDKIDLQTVFAEAIPQDRITAAGMASLEIDKFSMAACDLPFANR